MDYLALIIGIAGVVFGFILRVLFDIFKSPKLVIVSSSEPYIIHTQIVDNILFAYRVRISNRQKFFLNSAAENCIAWVELDFTQDNYQLSWVGGFPETTINVGDFREFDFIARGNKTGKMYLPRENGYFEPNPKVIISANEINGMLRITSRNGRKVEKGIKIIPTGKHLLDIVFL